jgi:hypothetical protein
MIRVFNEIITASLNKILIIQITLEIIKNHTGG